MWWSQIGAAGAEQLAYALKVNSSLTSLNLGCNRIGDAGAAQLAQALQGNSSLTCLDLGSNRIGNAGASHLAATLQFNSTLTDLHLWNNRMERTKRREIKELIERNKWNRIRHSCLQCLLLQKFF